MATNERPNRLVVALGIATVVLFSANLLAMLSQRVWPQLHEAMFASQDQVEMEAPEIIIEEERPVKFEVKAPEVLLREIKPRIVVGEALHIVHKPSKHTVYRIHRSERDRCRHKHHVNTRVHTHEHVNLDLDLDLDDLERDIEREMERLNGNMSNMERDLEKALTLRLHSSGLSEILVKRENSVKQLEEQLNQMSRQFEVRVREHEAAARARVEAVERDAMARKARVIVREYKENQEN